MCSDRIIRFVKGAGGFAVVCACLLALAPAARAEGDDAGPEQLQKQRSDLYLSATRVPLADMADDLDQFAVASETCRAEHGSKACGLPDKALESDKLEDRYAYYVKRPVEANAKARSLKIDRRNWAEPDSPAHAERNQDK